MSLFVRIAVWTSLIFMVCNTQAMICSIGREPDPANDNKLRWVIPVPDPCQCTKIRLGGINTRTPCRPFDVTYYDAAIISSDPMEIWTLLECSDINECSMTSDLCGQPTHGTCVNTPRSFYCNCNSGYHLDGGSCKDINECVENTHTCNSSAHEECFNTPGSHDCECQDGYQRSHSDGPCEACHFSTVPHPTPYSYMFILEPQISPFTVNFGVKTGGPAMIGLSESRTDRTVVIEILFGYSPGSKIVVRRCMPHLCGGYGGELDVHTSDTSRVTSSTEYHPFWIHYNVGVVTAGKGGQQETLVEWDAGAHHGRVPTSLHIGISTWEEKKGEWDFCQ